MSEVDLSLAQPGDECHMRRLACPTHFAGPTSVTNRYHLSHPYACDNCETYRRNGTASDHENLESALDIVRVMRNGVQITPALPVVTGPGKYVSAFMGGELVHQVIGQSDGGTWVGIDSDGDVEGWLSDGASTSGHVCNKLVRAYVPPETLTLDAVVEKLRSYTNQSGGGYPVKELAHLVAHGLQLAAKAP